MVAEPQEYQYNAEYPIVTGDMDETVIITYSPKYKAYQQKIREGQIQRAMKMMQSPGKSRKGKNPNDPAPFHPENFRIMKSEFEARPVFVRREDRIRAHFLTCHISLLVYRLLEKKLGKEFTCSQILETLRGLNMTLLSKDSGYIPSYKRTKLTDALHNAFGFRTDYEFISKFSMRSIIKETKQKNSTNPKIVHIDARQRTATTLIKYWRYGCFTIFKCQRWDYIILGSVCVCKK